MYYLDKYKFCPVCGSRLKGVSNFLECTNCKYRIFDNAKSATNIIIENDKEEILLVTRARDPFKGWYDLPGGFSESGESLEETGKREVKEELGINIEIGRYIGSYPVEYEYGNVFYWLSVAFFAAKLNKEKIVVGDDALDYKFVSKNKILNKKICYPNANIEALKIYLATFK